MSTQPSGKTLKVFSVRTVSTHALPGSLRQPHLLVAVASRAAAVRAFNDVGVRVNDAYLKTYGHETSNTDDIAVAMSAPGTVFCEIAEHPRAYEPVTPKAAR